MNAHGARRFRVRGLLVAGVFLALGVLLSGYGPAASGETIAEPERPIVFVDGLGMWSVRPDGRGWKRLNDCSLFGFDSNGRQAIGRYENDLLLIPLTGKSLVDLGECADGRNVPIRERYRLRIKGASPKWPDGYSTFAWAPDSRRILALENTIIGRDLVQRIFVFNADGSGHRRIEPRGLTAAPGYSVRGIAWSPRGDRIVFSRGSEIAIMNPDGSNARLIYEAPEDEGWAFTDFDWHGDQIVFFAHRSDMGPEIAVISSDGSGYRTLVPPRRGVGFAPRPSWSRDGRQIAVLLGGRPGNTYHLGINLIDPRSGRMRGLRFKPDRVKATCPPQTSCVDLVQYMSVMAW
jgi:hypothetical protein